MSNTKYTPPPWRQNGAVIVGAAGTPNGQVICQLRVGPLGDGVAVDYRTVEGPTVKANAALISAAPDLLAACEYAEHRLATAIRRGRKTDQPCLDVIQAAIAKAKPKKMEGR